MPGLAPVATPVAFRIIEILFYRTSSGITVQAPQPLIMAGRIGDIPQIKMIRPGGVTRLDPNSCKQAQVWPYVSIPARIVVPVVPQESAVPMAKSSPSSPAPLVAVAVAMWTRSSSRRWPMPGEVPPFEELIAGTQRSSPRNRWTAVFPVPRRPVPPRTGHDVNQ